MIGTIKVTGIRFHAFHGLTELERKIGVRYRVDVELTHDIARAVRADRIEETIDYRAVHDRVVAIARRNSYHLIETLAHRTAACLLEEFGCARVRIEIAKETPVVDGVVDSVGVALELGRGDETR